MAQELTVDAKAVSLALSDLRYTACAADTLERLRADVADWEAEGDAFEAQAARRAVEMVEGGVVVCEPNGRDYTGRQRFRVYVR